MGVFRLCFVFMATNVPAKLIVSLQNNNDVESELTKWKSCAFEAFFFRLFLGDEPEGPLEKDGPSSFDSCLLIGEFLFLSPANSLFLTNLFGMVVR